MNLLLGPSLLVFASFFQTTFLPLNLGFAGLVAYNLFAEKINSTLWIGALAFLIAILGNYNLGLSLIAFSLCFIFLEILGKILPVNNLTKGFLVLLSLPLAEVMFLTLERFFQ